ncbi:MAG: Gfo/Idh/MocA family oxidoreductase [Cytophagales bacterium]|nr:Gfo/Idh/MocA family oxidoreductase [Cytophagales bacterium]
MKVIGTALLSFGMSGKVFHAPLLSALPGFRLLGAWERTKKEIATLYQGTKSYSSFNEMLADPDVDLVVVNTPTATHFSFAKEALHAGKHVVVEKAFTTNADEAIELADLARQLRLTLSVFQNRRWDSDFMTVKQVLERGAIGDVVETTISFNRYNLAPNPKAHKETPGPGSGNLKDLGPHLIDQALVLFGTPDRVFADIRKCRPGSQVDDSFDLMLYYPTRRVRLTSGYHISEPGPGYVLHGLLGSFVKSRADVQEMQLKSGMRPVDPGYGIELPNEAGVLHLHRQAGSVVEKVISLPGNYTMYYNQLYDALAGSGIVPVTPEEGVLVMKVIDAALESQATQRVIKI